MSIRKQIKCYRCGTTFQGAEIDEIVKANNIKMDGRGYFCECKAVDDFAARIGKKPEKQEKKKDGIL